MDEICNRIDLAIGRRIRMRRAELKLAQQALAEYLHVTADQIEKFETGFARVSAWQMQMLSDFLGVGPDYFFGFLTSSGKYLAATFVEDPRKPLHERLLLAFGRIEDESLKRSVVALVEAIAGSEEPPSGTLIPFPPHLRR